MARTACLPLASVTLAAVVAVAVGDAPRQFALLVGVKNYDGTGLDDLHFTENDATHLADVLRDANYRRVVLMTETEAFAKRERGFFPNAANVRKQVTNLLELAKAGDTAVIGFSGHGLQFVGSDELFFCPEQSNLADPTTLVSLKWVQDELKKCKADVKLLIADTCRDTVPVPGKPKSPAVEGLVSKTRPEMPELPQPPQGVVALFSCSTGKKSFESPKHKRGFLFHHVIEGLQGKAANASGEVTLSRLVSYAVDEVQLAVQDEFPTRSQRPQMLGEIGGRVPLVRGAMPPALRANAPIPKLAAPSSGEKTLTLDLGGGVSMEFVRIARGDFLRGAPDGEAMARDDEKPQKRVTISKDFYLGKYEVTQAQYKALTGKTPSYFSATGQAMAKVAGMDTSNFPVDSVTKEDAMTFCAKLKEKTGRNATLPTEAQWEYACRAGTTTPFHFGTSLNGEQANCNGRFPYGTATRGNYFERTGEVGQYAPNDFGLYDMHGNVREWCSDQYDPDYYKTSLLKDPLNLIVLGDVSRGGSWYEPAHCCRAACRSGDTLATVRAGFRVAIRLD